MKVRFLVCLAAGGVAIACSAVDVEKVKVTGDNVSLRTRPDVTNSEVLDRAMLGDELIYLDETNDWVAVQAPDTMNFWVSSEFVENGKITSKKLNVRAGPSQNYDVMAVLDRGDAVQSRGERHKEWMQIAPPAGSKIWISAEFVERIKPVVEEKKPPVEELKPLVLKMDPSRPQGAYTEIGGVLQRANPGLYKLVMITAEMKEDICLVRGNKEQMEEFLNQSVLLKGKIYWALDVPTPILEPKVIVLSPLLKGK